MTSLLWPEVSCIKFQVSIHIFQSYPKTNQNKSNKKTKKRTKNKTHTPTHTLTHSHKQTNKHKIKERKKKNTVDSNNLCCCMRRGLIPSPTLKGIIVLSLVFLACTRNYIYSLDPTYHENCRNLSDTFTCFLFLDLVISEILHANRRVINVIEPSCHCRRALCP